MTAQVGFHRRSASHASVALRRRGPSVRRSKSSTPSETRPMTGIGRARKPLLKLSSERPTVLLSPGRIESSELGIVSSGKGARAYLARTRDKCNVEQARRCGGGSLAPDPGLLTVGRSARQRRTAGTWSCRFWSSSTGPALRIVSRTAVRSGPRAEQAGLGFSSGQACSTRILSSTDIGELGCARPLKPALRQPVQAAGNTGCRQAAGNRTRARECPPAWSW